MSAYITTLFLLIVSQISIFAFGSNKLACPGCCRRRLREIINAAAPITTHPTQAPMIPKFMRLSLLPSERTFAVDPASLFADEDDGELTGEH